jgi:hypothetical protein
MVLKCVKKYTILDTAQPSLHLCCALSCVPVYDGAHCYLSLFTHMERRTHLCGIYNTIKFLMKQMQFFIKGIISSQKFLSQGISFLYVYVFFCGNLKLSLVKSQKYLDQSIMLCRT